MELSPVRANMVAGLGDCIWSSYQCNGLGKAFALCSSHAEYLSLGTEAIDRQIRYRALFRHHVEAEMIDEIR